MVWIVKIPKHYRNPNTSKYVGPFDSFEKAQDWVQSTFIDYQNYAFSYIRVDAPL